MNFRKKCSYDLSEVAYSRDDIYFYLLYNTIYSFKYIPRKKL